MTLRIIPVQHFSFLNARRWSEKTIENPLQNKIEISHVVFEVLQSSVHGRQEYSAVLRD